jgi:uncharacterized membrane protein YfcA
VKEAFLPGLMGLATGILSAWGVGGGTLLLLCMTLFLGVDQATAQGINLLYFLPTAAVSLYYHHKNDLLDKEALHHAIWPGVLLGAVSAYLATGIDFSLLRKPFGVFLLLAGAMTMFSKNES